MEDFFYTALEVGKTLDYDWGLNFVIFSLKKFNFPGKVLIFILRMSFLVKLEGVSFLIQLNSLNNNSNNWACWRRRYSSASGRGL